MFPPQEVTKAISQLELSGEVMVIIGHRADASVVNENQVTGAIPVL